MEHPRRLRKGGDDVHAVLVCLPLVDDDGLFQLPGQLHLSPKGLLLNIPRDVLIVIIQADLSNGLYFWVFPAQLPVAVQHGIVYLVRRVRMGADGSIDVVVFPGQSRRRLGGGGGTAWVHQQCNARLGQGSGQKLCPVRIKGPVIHMGVGIKQHFSILSQRSLPQGIRPIPRPGGPGG